MSIFKISDETGWARQIQQGPDQDEVTTMAHLLFELARRGQPPGQRTVIERLPALEPGVQEVTFAVIEFAGE